MNKFVIVDGNALMHRAFHALPPLTSKNKDMVNAVYGFFSMFIKIIEDILPSYIAVCFDRPKPTFRKELYVGYQAKRPQMADELSLQFVLVHKALDKIGVEVFEVDGYEADDVIGTLAAQATSLKSQKKKLEFGNWNLEVIVVSSDRDMLQLVNSHVKMLSPLVGITKMILYDTKLVEEKYGLKPSQFVDYKALVGDSSDNYPGVNGIGPKTAQDLLKKYETFEGVYKNLDKLPARLAKALATDAEQAALAKKLAKIVVDVPIQFDIKKCAFSSSKMEKILKVFDELGFKSLVKRASALSISKSDDRNKNASDSEKDQSKQLGLL